MSFEVTPVKLDGRNWAKPFKTFSEAKTFAIERAKVTRVSQVVKPVKEEFATYLITHDGWQVNRKTRKRFRIRGFHGAIGSGDKGKVYAGGQDDLSGSPDPSSLPR